MSKNIITISREFGSGGRTIAKEVAKKLGYAYYDKELVKQISMETGFSEGFVEENGEYASAKNWLAAAFSHLSFPGVMAGPSMDDFLWAMQRKVILDLAEKGKCVIVGRCADFILKDRTDCFHVFIHADPKARAERIVRRYGTSEQSPEKRLDDKDRRRRLYYKHYTEREWRMAQKYHLSLNSGEIGQERCVEMIVQLAQAL